MAAGALAAKIGTPTEVDAAVRRVSEHLYDPSGGLLDLFEVGAGALPNAGRVRQAWRQLQQDRHATR